MSMQDQSVAGSKAANTIKNPYKLEINRERQDTVASLAKFFFNVSMTEKAEVVLDDIIEPLMNNEVVGYRVKAPGAKEQFNDTAEWTAPGAKFDNDNFGRRRAEPKGQPKSALKDEKTIPFHDSNGGSYGDYMNETSLKMPDSFHIEPSFTAAANPKSEFKPGDHGGFAHLATGIDLTYLQRDDFSYRKSDNTERNYEYKQAHEADENYHSGVHLAM